MAAKGRGGVLVASYDLAQTSLWLATLEDITRRSCRVYQFTYSAEASVREFSQGKHRHGAKDRQMRLDIADAVQLPKKP